jgi:hypothetical protein
MHIAEMTESLGPDKHTKWIKSFTPWCFGLTFNIILCWMHSTHFDPNPPLYAALFLLVNAPWTLLCVRNAIVVPNGSAQIGFCVCYEALVTKSFLRNHIILQVFSILGFGRSNYFALMLLDGINISTTLTAIIRSVSAPGASLMMVFYLFLISIVIYASFGARDLSEYFYVPTFDPEEEVAGEKQCATTLGCFWFLFYVSYRPFFFLFFCVKCRINSNSPSGKLGWSGRQHPR